ncbi:MAG: xylulokinase [Planctomycetota bacterium]|nr:MAG: xylulokinase [Planctomycetota bacterium]
MLLGIDIGTTGTRAIVVGLDGNAAGSAVEEYPLSTPRPLWSEQNPADWWRAAVATIRKVLETVPASAVRAVGLSGQMHGLVLLDDRGEVLRPAILWNDQRTARECEEITRRVGEATLVAETSNPVLTGFTAGKIAWVRRHEPRVLDRTRRILLPKDYIRFRLTGEFATEVSDASGTSLLNVPQRAWSRTMLDALEIDEDRLPRVFESVRITGAVTAGAAAETGLIAGTPVVGGGGDQAAGAIGAGIVRPGAVSVSLGTSGVVFAHAALPRVDPRLRTHTFCHAVPGAWHVMGVMLSAGGSLRWWRDAFCESERAQAGREDVTAYDLIARGASRVPPGSDGLVFLPYLTGERTPHPDPHARGAFVGATLRHGRDHFARAVFEGVAFGLKDSLEILKAMNVPAGEIRLTGGGARSPLWRQILADVFHQTVTPVAADEGPAFGAALLAGVGCGAFASVEQACDAAVRLGPPVAPQRDAAQAYDEAYARYTRLYPALRDVFPRS